MANTNFNAQGATNQVRGAYAQPAPGITEAIVTPADTSGNAYVTSLASGGSANLQVASYRDSQVTVQAGSTASAPSAGGTVVTITPGTAGLWEITGLMGISGTTATFVDSNNMALKQTATARISPLTFPVTGTTANQIPAVIPATILNLSAADTVLITAVGNSTAGSVYGATLVARRVG